MRIRTFAIIGIVLIISFNGSLANISSPISNSKKVIVIGAGLSGMSASLDLIKSGADVDVLLLEKNNQVGGKFFTVSLGGVECNVGAQYLFKVNHPIFDSYLETLPKENLNKGGVVWDDKFVMLDGVFGMLKVPMPITAKIHMFFAFNKLFFDSLRISKNRDFYTDINPENNYWKYLEGQSCYEYLSRYHPDVYKFFNNQVGSEAGGCISNLSALLLVRGYATDQEMSLIKGGNKVIIEHMKEDYLSAGGQLEFNAEVTDVNQSGDLIRVTCRDGRVFTGDYVIVATPSHVVKWIVKDLPSEKLEALNAVRYGSIGVIGLQVKGLPSDKDAQAVLFIDENFDGYICQTGDILGNANEGIVISVITTDHETLELEDEELIQNLSQLLRKVSPEFDPENDILNYSIVRFSKGIVQFYPGFISKYLEVLREPNGRIYFAGDYTHSPEISGAVWSGTRAATEVLEEIKGPIDFDEI